MNATKMMAVLKREYLQAVRKKMFIIMTVLLPFLTVGLFLIPTLVASRGLGMKKVAVIDGTGQLREAFRRPNERPKADVEKETREALSGRRRNPGVPSRLDIEYVDQRAAADVNTAAKPYLDRLSSDKKSAQRLDGVLLIPAGVTGDDAKLTYYSSASADVITQEQLSRLTNRAVQRMRLTANGISPETVDTLMRDVRLESVQLSRSGEQKKGGEANLIFGFIFVALLMLPSFVYGTEIMRGIVQEKTERVVEVLVSSMRPIELLTGKIVGVALVGLTQITVWVTMLIAIGIFGAATAAGAGINVMQFLRPSIFVWFFVFFLLAYFTYVCIYAIAGAVCNSDKEAQQLVGPIVMVMMLPWILMFPIIMNPDSNLAVGFSLSPVFGPLTMFVRTIVSEPPVWHFAVSIAVSLATIAAFFWMTAKIFRIGILSYGKRPTIPELWRWMKVA